MKKIAVLIVGVCCTLFSVQSQTVKFICSYNGEELQPGKAYYNEFIADSIKIERLTFYISSLRFKMKDGSVKNYPQKYILMDIEKPGSLVLNDSLLNTRNVKQISFMLGIDSITSVSGVFGGDLDPTNGMYWTWQSGYINLKLEGSSPVLKSRNQQFQYHLGGYAYPFKSVQQVVLDVKKKKNIVIELSLEELFESEGFYERKTAIMSPGADAVKLSEKIAKLFRIRP